MNKQLKIQSNLKAIAADDRSHLIEQDILNVLRSHLGPLTASDVSVTHNTASLYGWSVDLAHTFTCDQLQRINKELISKKLATNEGLSIEAKIVDNRPAINIIGMCK